MMNKGMLTACQTFIFLGVLSSVSGNDVYKHISNYMGPDPDYESLPLYPFLPENCEEYPDVPPCYFWNEAQETAYKEHMATLKPRRKLEITTTKLTEEPTKTTEQTLKDDLLNELTGSGEEKHIVKRYAASRRKYPAGESYKRGPGFRSWGGKRDYNSFIIKRPKFTSWGGKREYDTFSEETDEWNHDKRTKFSTWGGKRDETLDKRSKFRSWGGKRDQNNVETEKRDSEDPISYDQRNKREPWNGKTLLFGSVKDHVPKRPKFQSWGGKRTVPLWESSAYLQPNPSSLQEVKRGFNSWGGKRNDGETIMENDKRGNFNSWRGKRDDLIGYPDWVEKTSNFEDDTIGLKFDNGDILTIKTEEPTNQIDPVKSIFRKKREDTKQTQNPVSSKDVKESVNVTSPTKPRNGNNGEETSKR